MTLSEYVQAHRLRELRAGRSGYDPPPTLDCANGTRIVVDAAPDRHSYPQDYCGPWTMFGATWIDGPPPGEPFTRMGNSLSNSVAISAGDLVRLLERLGWPAAQLGERWKKRGVAARK